MSQGKTKAALRLLTEQSRDGILHLDDLIDTGEDTRKVCDILIDKHPPSQPAHLDSIIEDEPPEIHPVMFESLDASVHDQVFCFAGQWSSWPFWPGCTKLEKAVQLI